MPVAETYRGCPMASSVFLFACRERWMHNQIQIDFLAKLWQQKGLKSPMGVGIYMGSHRWRLEVLHTAEHNP